MDNLLAGAVEVIMTLESRVSTIGEQTSGLVSNGVSRYWFLDMLPDKHPAMRSKYAPSMRSKYVLELALTGLSSGQASE